MFDKLAKFLGFEASDIGESGRRNQNLLNTIYNDATSLSDYFYHRYYDKENNLFFLEDKTLGFIVEISPIVGADESLIKNLDYFFNNELPYGSWLQFLLLASNDVSHILDQYSTTRTNKNPILKKLTKNYIDFIVRMANNFKNYDGRLARDFRIFINFSRFYKANKTDISKDINDALFFKKILVKKLETFNLAPRVCDDKDLIKLSKELWNVNFSAKNRDSNQKKRHLQDQLHETLDRRMLPNIGNYKVSDRGVNNLTNKTVTRAYKLKGLPEEFSLSNMVNLLGSDLYKTMGINARFVISYSVATNIEKAAQSGVQVRGKRVMHAAEQWYCRNNINLQRESLQWKNINDRAKNGERFLTDCFQLAITTPVESIEEAEQSLLSLYRSYDWELVADDYFHLPALLSMIPLHQPLYWSTLRLYKQVRICMSSDITAKLPIHAEWKGVPIPGVLFLGRRGQLFHWNPFFRISSGNYNVCVFGPSGGGKSVFLQMLSSSMMAQNVKVFILDIGQSFAEMATVLGGEIIQFGRDAKLVLNPFSGFKEGMEENDFKDLVRCAKELLIIMCGAVHDRGRAELEKAIVDSLRQYNYQMNIDGFVSYLNRLDSKLLQEYGATLYSYTKNGVYGRYFAGSNCAKFQKQITVFEFEEIKKDRKLLSIVLQVLLIEVTNQFFISDRSKKFMIVVDEAWMLLDYAAGFFAEFARTVRKYGGSLVTCVQNFNDLQKTEQHKAILENSTWTMLLKQDEKGLNAFKNSEAFKDILPLIRPISLVPEKYCEMLISTTGVNVIGRLVLDSYSRALYSTDSSDFNYLKEMQKQNIDLDEAVEQLAKKKYSQE